jgi:hypothetical protein
MAVPAFIERITKEDPDQTRRLSGHDIEAAVCAIRAQAAGLSGTGTWLTLAEFKTAVSATTDDETDLDNIVSVVTSQSNDGKKNAATAGVWGILNLAHLGYFNAAAARTRLGIATP